MKKYQIYFNHTNMIAPKRDARPFINERDTACPFCLANEDSLENIIDESWKDHELLVRIVSNRYPVTSQEYVKGVHDVVIDTASHTKHPKDFSVDHWRILLRHIQKRWINLMKDSSIQFIQVFKNYGEKAGASISHSHWQIIALEEIPYSMLQKYIAYYQDKTCYLCHALHQQEGFCVWESALFEVWVPPIPIFPYETWIIPKQHHTHYGELSLEEIDELGKLIKYLLIGYHQIRPQFDFNICMMSGDVRGQYPYHFYIQIVMRIGQIAGFEIATGCHIISVESEVYANELKNILKGMYE